PTMEEINAPARIARVAVGPGQDEAWAFGYSSATHPGWDGKSSLGQLVFLHYRPDTGWQITGPALKSDGSYLSARLYGISINSSGTGWAVGDQGVMVHLVSGAWRVSDTRAPATLYAVSVS